MAVTVDLLALCNERAAVPEAGRFVNHDMANYGVDVIIADAVR